MVRKYGNDKEDEQQIEDVRQLYKFEQWLSDSYLFPNIYTLVDNVSGCMLINLLDGYS